MIKKAVIIGGGPGGYPPAFTLAEKGVEVTLIEKDRLGGTCLNRGCIPTKVLLHAGNILREIKTAQSYGINAQNVDFDFTKLCQHRDEIIQGQLKGIERLCNAKKVRVMKGTGSFEMPQKIRIKETGEIVEGDVVIIATGSLPAALPIPGGQSEEVLNSDQLLTLKTIPASIVIVGAGYIGLEFAQIFNRFGSKVTVLEMVNQVLPSEDAEVSGFLGKALSKEGIKIFTGVVVKEIAEKKGKKVVTYEKQNQSLWVEADYVFAAVGRVCNTEGLGLEKIGVKTERGRVLVNKCMETNIPGVYATGDVIGGPMLAHVAMAEGRIAANQIMGDGEPGIDYTAAPRCIYTYPEVASVGLTESQAKEVDGDILIERFPLEASAKATILGAPGFVKVICDKKKYKKILGIHLVSPNATDLISEAVLAMNIECTIEELANTIHPHPTLSESILETAISLNKR